jgi:hypothetical protein
LIRRIIADLADIAGVEQSARSEGRTLTMVMMPKPVQQQVKPGPKPEKTAAATGEA